LLTLLQILQLSGKLFILSAYGNDIKGVALLVEELDVFAGIPYTLPAG
jgi:hypothetical protein